MKTIHTLIVLASLAAGVRLEAAPPAATPASTNTPQPINLREEAMEPAYTQAGITNRPVRTTNAGAATPTAVTTTNPVPGRTNVPTAILGAPNAVAPATTFPRPVAAPGAPGSAPQNTIPALPAPAPRPSALRPPGGATTAAAATPVLAPLTGTLTNATGAGEEQVFPPGLIKFQEADLVQVLDVYQELTGRTVMRPNNLPATKITIRSQTPLTRKEAILALDSILSMNQITMIPQGDKFVKAVPAAQTGTEGTAFSTTPHGDLPEAGTIIAQVVQITNGIPAEVAQALQPFAKLPQSILAIPSSGIIILRDYAENIKRMMELLEKIDVPVHREINPVVIPIKYALAEDIAQVLSTLTAGGGGGATTVGGQPSRAGLSGGGRSSGGAGGLGGLGGAQGYNPANPMGNQNLGGGANAGGAPRSSFQDRLQQIVRRASTPGGAGDIVVLGETKIIADARTNSLLIFATKEDIATIKDIIDKLDVVLAQVLIEAIILEVTLGDEYNLGFDYLQDGHRIGALRGRGSINRPLPLTSAAATGTNAVGALNGLFNYFGTLDKYKLEASLTAAATDSRIRILSRPRVQTSHAEEANLFVGRTRPYPTGSSSLYGGSYSQIQQLQIGITLSVLPLINADGLVVMDIRQKVQDVGKDIEIDGNLIPETIEREANAKVAVRDRETIMLGGFISSSKSDSKAGVPILKDIPLLGALFRSTSKKHDRVELMVFIRPTVMPTPTSAAIFATEEKRKLPAIYRSEREVIREEEKMQQKFEEEEAKDKADSAKEKPQSTKGLFLREGFSE